MSDEKECPRCAETIKARAVVCRHCGHEMPQWDWQKRTEGKRAFAMPTWGIIVCVVMGSAFLLSIIGAAIGPAPSPDASTSRPAQVASASPPPPARAAAVPGDVVRISAAQLQRDFEANEIAAQARYQGRAVEVTGRVDAIDQDWRSQPVLRFETDNPIIRVSADFDQGDIQRLAAVQRGTRATVRCRRVTESLGFPMLDDCELL